MSGKLVQAQIAAEEKDQKLLEICAHTFTEVVSNSWAVLCRHKGNNREFMKISFTVSLSRQNQGKAQSLHADSTVVSATGMQILFFSEM